MSSIRSIVVFLLLAVVLGFANYFLYRPSSPRQSSRLHLVDPIYDATNIAISSRGQALVQLRRETDWRLVSPFAGVADEQKVKRLLDRLCQEEISDVIYADELTRLGRRLADFRLDTPLVSLEVISASGRRVEVFFGGPTPAGDGVYAAVAGIEAVFVVPSDAVASVDITPDGFRRHSVFDFAPESVVSFTLRRGEESQLAFVRNGDEWSVNGVKAMTSKIRQLLNSVVSAEAVDFLWPTGSTNETERVASSFLAAHGLDPENAFVISLVCDDGVERRVSFGQYADEKLVCAFIHDPETVVTVPMAIRDQVSDNPAFYTDSRLFPVDVSAVASFTVSDGHDVCSLMRDVDGSWRLESPVSAPADQVFVKAVLDRISVINSSDVADTGLAVSVGTNGASAVVPADLVLGKGGQLKTFRSLEILNIGADHVRRLVSTSGSGAKPVSVVFDRERKSWLVESAGSIAEVDANGVKSVLSAISPLVAVRIEKLRVLASDLDDYGLDKPVLTIAIDRDLADSVRRNLIIGGKADGGRYVTVGATDAVFVVSEDVLSKLGVRLIK